MEERDSHLAHYLGEHQQQAFFGLINIRMNKDQWQTHKIGSVVPFYVGRNPDESSVSKNPSSSTTICLAMILHIFKRSSPTSLPTRSELKTIQQIQQDQKDENYHQYSHNHHCESNVQDLVTVKIYFHISHMKSVDEPKISADNRKRIYAQPHKDEYVVHPNQMTMTMKDFIARVKRGNENVNVLLKSSSSLPETLVKSANNFRGNHDNCCGDKKPKPIQYPKFIVVSESLYNRVKTVERLQSEGFTSPKRPTFGWSASINDYTSNKTEECSIIPAMKESFDLFYTGICSVRPHFAVSRVTSDDVCPDDTTTSNSQTGENINNKNSPYVVECKASLQHVHRNFLSIWPFCENTRIVFIRRQSNHFNLSIMSSTPANSINNSSYSNNGNSFGHNTSSSHHHYKGNFTPAKIRRTRVRGTDQMAIKLRRPISLPETIDDDFDDPLLRSVINDSLMFEQFDSYSSSNSNSPHVKCNHHRSEMLMRTRKNPNATSISYAEITTSFSTISSNTTGNNNSNNSIASSGQLVHSSSDSNIDQRNLRANPPVNKRVKYIDKDLELAIQRSLVDKTKRRNRKIQRAPEHDVQKNTNPTTTTRMSERQKALTRSSSAVISCSKTAKTSKTSKNIKRKFTKCDTSESDDGDEQPDEVIPTPAIKKESSLPSSPISKKEDTQVNSPENSVSQKSYQANQQQQSISLTNNNNNPNLNDSNEDAKTEPQTCCDDQVQMMYTNVNLKSPCSDPIESTIQKEVPSTREEINNQDIHSLCKALPEYMPPLNGVSMKPPPLDYPPGFMLPTTMWTMRNLPLPPPIVDVSLKKSQHLLTINPTGGNPPGILLTNQNNTTNVMNSAPPFVNNIVNNNSNNNLTAGFRFLHDSQHQSTAVFQQLASANLLGSTQSPAFQQIITLPPQNSTNILGLHSQALMSAPVLGNSTTTTTPIAIGVPSSSVTPQASSNIITAQPRNNPIPHNLIFTNVGDNLHLLNSSGPLQTNKVLSQPATMPVGLLSTTPSVNFQIPPSNMNFILNSNGNQLRMPFSML